MNETFVPWPSQADYIMALQDPAGAFRDPRLRRSEVECDDVLGLPKPRSGQMASVYKLSDEGKTLAVRCFNFASAERGARYAAISTFLARHPNPYTVHFAYDEEGIAVGDRRYPIVSMEWVEGDLLPAYIAKHLDAPGVLERLAGAWVELVRDLHAMGMAHGDLQHGNVLVTGAGELKLIDYDGMFVPAFAGEPSSELGHPNYQHPCRQTRHFGPQLDNFAAWVVYLSIAAVAHDRRAWESLRFGDECLAFRHADYVRPSASDAFARLTTASGPQSGKLARYVQSMLSHEPDALPALEKCTRSTLTAVGEGHPIAAWALPVFDSEPLEPGVYREPFGPGRPVPPPPPPRPLKISGMAAGTGLGVVATGAGAVVFHLLGFSIAQYGAIVVLGWVLAGIIVLASRGPKAPSS